MASIFRDTPYDVFTDTPYDKWRRVAPEPEAAAGPLPDGRVTGGGGVNIPTRVTMPLKRLRARRKQEEDELLELITLFMKLAGSIYA